MHNWRRCEKECLGLKPKLHTETHNPCPRIQLKVQNTHQHPLNIEQTHFTVSMHSLPLTSQFKREHINWSISTHIHKSICFILNSTLLSLSSPKFHTKLEQPRILIFKSKSSSNVTESGLFVHAKMRRNADESINETREYKKTYRIGIVESNYLCIQNPSSDAAAFWQLACIFLFPLLCFNSLFLFLFLFAIFWYVVSWIEREDWEEWNMRAWIWKFVEWIRF